MMDKMLYMFCSILGGWIGWALGSAMGMYVAFFLSIIGTALGVYLARRITRSYL